MKITELINQENPSVQAELRTTFKHFPKDAEVKIKTFPAGSKLVKEGVPCRYVYYLLEGEVTPLYYHGNNSFVARRLKKRAVIGDIAVLGNLDCYSTSVIVLTECRVIVIRSKDYWAWILADSDFLKNQLENAVGILLGELTNKRYMESETQENRLLSYFVWYCRKEGIGPKDIITVRKTREQIAEEVGDISVRTVYRKIFQFAEEGYLTIVHGKIRISFQQMQEIEKQVFGMDSKGRIGGPEIK